MKRVERSTSRLREFTSNSAAFKSSGEEVKHEAEMLAAIAVAMQQSGMPDGDDDDYAAFCDTMKDAGKQIVGAVKSGDLDSATKAMGNISRACDDCHEIYRG